MESRINVEKDNALIAILKMSKGNIGAAEALIHLVSPEGESIGSEALFTPWDMLLLIDKLRIFDTDLYVLYKDICEKDLASFMAVIISTQIGILEADVLKDACSRQDYSGRELVDAETIYYKVKERLSFFDLGNLSNHIKK